MRVERPEIDIAACDEAVPERRVDGDAESNLTPFHAAGQKLVRRPRPDPHDSDGSVEEFFDGLHLKFSLSLRLLLTVSHVRREQNREKHHELFHRALLVNLASKSVDVRNVPGTPIEENRFSVRMRGA